MARKLPQIPTDENNLTAPIQDDGPERRGRWLFRFPGPERNRFEGTGFVETGTELPF
jgi:hypothetical protein